MISETCLLWLDLEMTGLGPEHNTILEIASLLTNNNLDIIARGPALVINQPESVLETMNDWCKKQHAKSGLIASVRASKVSLSEAETQTLDFLQAHCKKDTAILCGNSIHQDRAFLEQHMPRLFDYLHYRIIDVSSIKELIKRWYSQDPLIEFKKSDLHRALIDTEESIEELKHYRKNFFK